MPNSFSFSSFNARRTAARDALNLSSVNGMISSLSGNDTGYYSLQHDDERHWVTSRFFDNDVYVIHTRTILAFFLVSFRQKKRMNCTIKYGGVRLSYHITREWAHHDSMIWASVWHVCVTWWRFSLCTQLCGQVYRSSSLIVLQDSVHHQ